MPWNIGQKKFIRANPDFTGETVWQQDQQATIKIIAARHDSHDQDLADGISACLNLDGVNEMRSDLNLNNNKLINVADGTNPTDGINWGQLEAQNTDLITYIDMGDQGSKDYADTIVGDSDIASASWNAAAGSITLTKGDASTVSVTLTHWDDLRAVTFRSSGPVVHKSEAFVSGGVIALQTLDSSRWTFSNNGASTLNFQPPSGADPYLGENYEVEGTVLVTNGAAPGAMTIQLNGVAQTTNVLGSESLLPNAKYLLSYVIHRASGNVYNALFIWSSVP